MNQSIWKILIFTCALWVSITSVFADTVNLTISAGSPNSVKFSSKAPLETVTGETDQIWGKISFDPADIGAGVKSKLTVNLTTLKTGNRIRDSHMYNNHLHTAQYPECVFTFSRIDAQPVTGLIDGASYKFKIAGTLALHGVEKEIAAETDVKWSEALGALDVTAKFEVYLSNFDIPRPQFLVMKLDEKLTIEVHFTAKQE